MKNKISVNVISSFNSQNFCELLKNNNVFDWEINLSEYNQVFQTLNNSESNIWKKKAHITLVWVTAESISPEFCNLKKRKNIDPNLIRKEVEHFCESLKSIKNNSNFIIVPNLITEQPLEGNLPLAYSKKFGLEYNLSLMNYYLAEQLHDEKNFYILNSLKWLTNCGINNSYNSKLWYLMKTPFSNEFFKQCINDLVNLYSAVKGSSKKLLILDLDDTLWGGIVGEVGWKNLRIGGHDHIGEAFQDFQNQIKSLKNYGIILAIASKNEESIAIEAIKKHPEMVLSIDDFVTHRINWEDKAKNINEMVNELNIGLQSVVFFDDSPFERERVKQSLPEVYVPNLPEDPSDLTTFLSQLHCFDTSHITKEDKKRVDLYKSEFTRNKLKKDFKSLPEWINTLDLTITIENIKNENVPRSLQLLNKTNQMNLTTRRLNEKEFENWIQKKENFFWTVRANDKFGDYGIIGIISISVENKVANVQDFILSCRVAGRCIEESMIKFLKEFCELKKMQSLNGKYVKTEKNLLCFNFLKRINIINNDNSLNFSNKVDDIKLPKINIIKSI